MRIKPCIDLHNGKVKQIIGASLRDDPCSDNLQTNFCTGRSAADFAAMYRNDGLVGGHVIMLGPDNDKQARAALTAYPDGLQIGGGINPGNAETWLAAGAAKVIVTSYLFPTSDLSLKRLKDMKETVGAENLVVDLSCRRIGDEYYVAARRWQEMTNLRIDLQTFKLLGAYCQEFLVHSVDFEGRREGVDIELIRRLAETCPGRVTYAGGIRSIDDLQLIAWHGRESIDATVGSALDIFGGDLPYADVVEFDRQKRS